MRTDNPPTATKRPRLGRSFSLLWGGEGVSLLGSATTSVLLPLLAVTEFGAGPAWMGVLTAAAWLPWLVIGLPAGAWLDRRDPRRVMIIADLVAAATLASVPVAWWLGVLGLMQLSIVAVLGGTCSVFFRTAYVKLLPRIVPDAGLEAANSRIFGTESAMQVVGPGVAALVAQLTSAAAGIIGSVVGFCVSAGCLARIEVDRVVPPPTAAEPLRTRIAEGVRLVVGDRNLRALMIIGGVSNFGLTGYAALLVLFLITELGLSESGVGLVIMVGSVGGLLGALVAPALARRLGTGRASTVLLVGRRTERPPHRVGGRRRPGVPDRHRSAAGRHRCRGWQRDPRVVAAAVRPVAPDGSGAGHDAGGQLRHHAARRSGGRCPRLLAGGPAGDHGAGRCARRRLRQHPRHPPGPLPRAACGPGRSRQATAAQ